MKIQLLLNNREVEIIEDITISLNKTFENLDNPTKIISDYTKNINIPITYKNNNILSYAYRLDRLVINNNGNDNIGLYLDPTKKIPAKLLYNNEVVLEGYAKFVSASQTTYTITLFGMLGDIFNKLKSIVILSDKLTEEQKSEEDGGAKYILHDRCNVNPKKLNYSYIFESWTNENPNVYGYCYDKSSSSYVGTIKTSDVIGFAPTYRGYYNDFSSDMIQKDETTIIPLSQYVSEKWFETYKSQNPTLTDAEIQEHIDSLKSDDIVNEMKDYQMKEYRSYMLKPYIYFNQLLQMYQDQIKLISDYEIDLDLNWFNNNNPYWTRMCYFFDFLDSRDNKDINEQITESESITRRTSMDTNTQQNLTCNLTTTISNDYINSSSSIVTKPFEIKFKVGGIGPLNSRNESNIKFDYSESMYFAISVQTTSSTTSRKNYYASFEDFATASQYITQTNLSEDNFIRLLKPLKTEKTIEDDQYTSFQQIITIPIPATSFTKSTPTTNISLSITISLLNQGDYLFDIVSPTQMTRISVDDMLPYFSCKSDPIYIIKNWRDNIQVNLANLFYKEDSSLFDIIIQYTKMFGLIWDIDYSKKKINILHKNTYFQNYNILDWNNKIDKSKEMKIEPISFGSKRVSFNYDSVDGYIYSGYRDKYNVNYGEKILSTGYDFGDDIKELFSGVQPSAVSSKSYTSINNLLDWNLTDTINYTTDKIPFIECENEDEDSPISIYNWYLRNSNYSGTAVSLTDDSALQKEKNEFCWTNPDLVTRKTANIPVFNIVIDPIELFPFLIGRKLGCVFNTPNEDYTNDKSVSDMLGNSIYDLCWKNYINDRYSVQNKKLTAYFHLTPLDFISFSFNKFVEVDNQLFIVNKIYDFNITKQGLTKVELVQISDTDVYTNGAETFPTQILSPLSVNVKGSTQLDTRGHTIVLACSTIIGNNNNLLLGSWNRMTGRMTIVKGTEIEPNNPLSDFSSYFYTETRSNDYNGQDMCNIVWQNMDGCKFVGEISYTFADNTIQSIPIIVDYTI